MDGEKIQVRRASAPHETSSDDKLKKVAFRPPEAIEADEEKNVGHSTSTATPHTFGHMVNDETSSKKPSAKKPLLKRLTKKHWIIVGGVAALLFIAVLAAFLIWPQKAAAPEHHAAQKAAPKIVAPTTVPSTLTGLPVAPSANQGPVTAVMIENTDYARPQSGLSQAGVVFEALTEGGITRFMALYQGENSPSIGPIRSARPYYLQWALGFDAAFAHDGGSSDALQDFSTWNVKDLNEMYNGSYYQRISSRESPHNLYSSISLLNTLEQKKGWTTSQYTGFVRKTAAPSTAPTATTIDFNPSYADYSVQYSYDAKNNAYLRSEDGSAMIDDNTGTQVEPKVVIGMIVPWSQGALDGIGAYYSNYAAIGSGQVDIFQDGTVTTGTWTKSSMSSQITFTDANGKTIGLDPGQTWITALGSSSLVSYK